MARLGVRVALLALLLVPSGALCAAPANGDIDGDGKVGITDVVGALRVAVGIVPADAAKTARGDLTGDGRLDIRDVIRILRIAVGLDLAAPGFVAAIPYSIYDAAQPGLVTLYAGAVAGATGYRLFRSEDGLAFSPVDASFDEGSTSVVSVLVVVPANRSTYFRVSALRGPKESPQSDTMACKPQQPMGTVEVTGPADGATTTPTVTWGPVAGAARYLVELRQATRPIRVFAVLSADAGSGVVCDQAHSAQSLVPWPGALFSGSGYWACVSALDAENWCEAYGARRFTTAPPDSSLPAGPFTGRWLASLPGPGLITGGLGLLLEEQGDTVRGSLSGFPLYHIARQGDVFTGGGSTGDASLDWRFVFSADRSTATGSASVHSAIGVINLDLTFTRQSTSPAIPDTTPATVTGTVPADGATGVSRQLQELRVTWSRPVLGGETRVVGMLGGVPIDAEDTEAFSKVTYDPATFTFMLALYPGTVLDANTRYQVILSLRDNVSWFDAYGVAPWLTPSKAYSFSFTTGAQ